MSQLTMNELFRFHGVMNGLGTTYVGRGPKSTAPIRGGHRYPGQRDDETEEQFFARMRASQKATHGGPDVTYSACPRCGYTKVPRAAPFCPVCQSRLAWRPKTAPPPAPPTPPAPVALATRLPARSGLFKLGFPRATTTAAGMPRPPGIPSKSVSIPTTFSPARVGVAPRAGVPARGGLLY